MEDCTFGEGEEDVIAPFCKALKKCHHLHHLNMKDGELGVAGLELLVGALNTSKAKLMHLYLGRSLLEEFVIY
jgi:Ran GTPase-activating protein (RanGAP) involved in mRNA processing and transport